MLSPPLVSYQQVSLALRLLIKQFICHTQDKKLGGEYNPPQYRWAGNPLPQRR
jgi:hypothetical protein